MLHILTENNTTVWSAKTLATRPSVFKVFPGALEVEQRMSWSLHQSPPSVQCRCGSTRGHICRYKATAVHRWHPSTLLMKIQLNLWKVKMLFNIRETYEFCFNSLFKKGPRSNETLKHCFQTFNWIKSKKQFLCDHIEPKHLINHHINRFISCVFVSAVCLCWRKVSETSWINKVSLIFLAVLHWPWWCRGVWGWWPMTGLAELSVPSSLEASFISLPAWLSYLSLHPSPPVDWPLRMCLNLVSTAAWPPYVQQARHGRIQLWNSSPVVQKQLQNW